MGRNETEGIAAIARPTTKEREVWTRMKVPWMKRSWGAFCW